MGTSSGSTVPRPSVLEQVRLARLAQRGIAGLLDVVAQRWAPAVDIGYGPVRMTMLMGPEANRLILQDRPDNFLWGKALSTLIPANGPTALVVTDGPEHARRRKLVQPAFAKRRVDGHLDLIVDEVDRTLAEWTTGRSLDAYAEGRQTVRRIVVRALFGAHLGDLADRIGAVFEPALAYVNKNPAARLDVNLRFNGYAKALRARAAVDELVQGEIDRRRRSSSSEGRERSGQGTGEAVPPDILTTLMSERTDDGDSLTDPEIRDQVRSLIAAGYDTTSSAVSWLVYALGANPAACHALRTQVRDTLGDDPPTVASLREMPLVDGAVRETLRLWPPGTVSVRHAVDDFECFGHTIPAGAMVAYSPYVTHRMADVWDDPLSFRPERWADGEPVPYAFVPFGGGRRNCVGFTLATLELQVFAARLVQQIGWRVDGPEPTSTAIASLSPTGGLPITVE